MSLTELFPAIKMLPRADKLRLMQFLVIDLAQEEGIPLLSADAEYPIWTPNERPRSKLRGIKTLKTQNLNNSKRSKLRGI